MAAIVELATPAAVESTGKPSTATPRPGHPRSTPCPDPPFSCPDPSTMHAEAPGPWRARGAAPDDDPS
jgi:hypothetical protein